MWNEPNLQCFWSGDKEEYLKLYEVSANAVKSVSSDYKIGGPATAVAEWIDDIIDYCSVNNVPLDFVSTHLYPQDEYCRYNDRKGSPFEFGMYYIENVKKVKETVLKSPKPNLGIYWTEFNTLSTDCTENITFLNNTALDRIYAASCIVRNMIETRNYCNAVSYWVASDIFEEEKMRHTPFSGTYGLVTVNGIKKAAYNAFKLMKKLCGNVILTETENAPLGCGLIITEEAGVYRAILWNNQIPGSDTQVTWTDAIDLGNIYKEDYVIEQAKIKRGCGSPYEEWLKMGRPENLAPFEEEYLNACSEMEYTICEMEKEYAFSILPDEVYYLEMKKKTSPAISKTINEDLEKQLFTH